MGTFHGAGRGLLWASGREGSCGSGGRRGTSHAGRVESANTHVFKQEQNSHAALTGSHSQRLPREHSRCSIRENEQRSGHRHERCVQGSPRRHWCAPPSTLSHGPRRGVSNGTADHTISCSCSTGVSVSPSLPISPRVVLGTLSAARHWEN